LTTTASNGPLLRVRGLTKDFPGQRALAGVDLDIGRGEVVALAGANGSGKSTLVKVLAGYHEADGGEIDAFGERVWPGSSRSPWRRRCHFVHQDLGLIPTLSATENIALVSGYRVGRLGRIAWRRQRREVVSAIERFGPPFDVDVPVAALSPTERTIVAIARALHHWSEGDALLVVDEPTAALHREEADKLFVAIRSLAERGAGVLFVSHRISEVLALADRVAVLRDGHLAGIRPTTGLDRDDLVELITGRAVDDLYVEPPPPRDDIALRVEGLSGDRLLGVSFNVHAGEVLGVTGLAGSGREELPPLLGGAATPTAGTVDLLGKRLPPGSVREAIRRKLVYVPSDRLRYGLVASRTLGWNISLSELGTLCRWGRIDNRRERRVVETWIDLMKITPPEPERSILQLSGGNQQKAVLAKWLRLKPAVVVLDEPTQGVDVGSKAAIYRHLAEAAAEGAGLLVCSSDAEELSAICDRVLVLRDGELVAEVHGRALTEARILREAVGASPVAVDAA
jgi:ribose transport system ATP-binding protein